MFEEKRIHVFLFIYLFISNLMTAVTRDDDTELKLANLEATLAEINFIL